MRANRVSEVSSAANPMGFEPPPPCFVQELTGCYGSPGWGGVGVLEAEGLSMRSLQLL